MVLVYRVPLLNPFRRRRRRRRRFREREKMFDASSVRKKVGDAVSTGRFFLPPERRKRERERRTVFSPASSRSAPRRAFSSLRWYRPRCTSRVFSSRGGR